MGLGVLSPAVQEEEEALGFGSVGPHFSHSPTCTPNIPTASSMPCLRALPWREAHLHPWKGRSSHHLHAALAADEVIWGLVQMEHRPCGPLLGCPCPPPPIFVMPGPAGKATPTTHRPGHSPAPSAPALHFLIGPTQPASLQAEEEAFKTGLLCPQPTVAV